MGTTTSERPGLRTDPSVVLGLDDDLGADETGPLLFETAFDHTARRGDAREAVHAGCFTAGTLIATPSGEVPVHLLRLGDAVLTRASLRRTIKWIGRRRYSPATMTTNPHLRPVRLRAGCLDDGLPRRDLLLAPMQALFLEDGERGGVLVPAAALVNGVSITREPASAVSYVHIELNSHDVILAEGAASETYVDCGNRAMFQNAAEFAALYPRNLSPSWSFCAPLLTQGYGLERIRARLNALVGLDARAVRGGEVRFTLERRIGCLEGWALNTSAPDVPVELEILLNGQISTRLPANRYRPDLDHAGLAGGRCGFSFPLPAGAGRVAIRQVER